MAFLSLLPMRPRPLKDENLDSWAMRLAHANATTATYFVKRVLDMNHVCQLDNYYDAKILKALELATGLPYSSVADTSFHHIQWKIPGTVYFEGKETVGSISFHQVQCQAKGLLKYTHRVCPLCWEADETPYVRKQWRLRFWTTCPVHNIFLSENCQVCGNTFKSSYRHHSAINNHGGMSVCVCQSCGNDVRRQRQIVESRDEFAVAAALESFYWERLKAQTFSCEDATELNKLRKMSRLAFEIYPPVTVLVPGSRNRRVPRDVTNYEDWF
jgi:hypothetical protein